MLRITYKTIIIRQVEQFHIATDLLGLILDTGAGGDSPAVGCGLGFGPESEENENFSGVKAAFFVNIDPFLNLAWLLGSSSYCPICSSSNFQYRP
jgi:hypothetical protein